jgi:two-component system sensor histidine kinase RegB
MEQSLREQRAAIPAGAAPRGRGRVRLGTLSNLRWLAVAGQSAALLVVHSFLELRVPLILCVAPIAVSALLNTVLAIAFPSTRRLSSREAMAFLAYDIVQLGVLLFLTGGTENPFALLFIAPVVVSAATLDVQSTFFLGALSSLGITVLSFVYFPLPWFAGETFTLPPLYRAGIWVSLVMGVGFTAMYAWRTANESVRMSEALAATQLALAREHRMSALGALAAGAAHELGTPLGTIALVAHELERDLPEGSHYADDLRLLRTEADRCRDIITRLASPEETVLGQVDQMPLGALLDDLAAPHREVDVAITVEAPPGPAPKVWRVPELRHGLGNLIENAADFAKREVILKARWDENSLSVDVIDDGPGFSVDIFEQIGEPYVTSRPRGRKPPADAAALGKPEGMGLGFFIAKTLIERTGGTVEAKNRAEGGAIVTATWPRGTIDGDEPPSQDLTL